MILIRADSLASVADRHMKLTVSAGTYSFDDFNEKFMVAVLQQIKYWKVPQIWKTKLSIK